MCLAVDSRHENGKMRQYLQRKNARAQEKRENEALLETNKSTNITKTPTPEPEFNIEEAYEDAMERTAGKESQTHHSAVEYIHFFTPNNI